MKAASNKITYNKMFWLFMAGSLFGVLLEGVFCHFKYGAWETHTVTVWGGFCIIYGFGMCGFYIISELLKGKNKFLQYAAFAVIADIVELLCGLILMYGLQMRAWDYRMHRFNIKGLISLKITLIWGIYGMLFCYIAKPLIDRVLEKMENNLWRVLCVVLSVFMLVNFIITFSAIGRWSLRHKSVQPRNRIESRIDKNYPDDKMQKRFCEWHFLDEPYRNL